MKYLYLSITLAISSISYTQGGLFRTNANMDADPDHDWFDSNNWDLLSGVDDGGDGIPSLLDTAEIGSGHICNIGGAVTVNVERLIIRCGSSSSSDPTVFNLDGLSTLNVTNLFQGNIFGTAPAGDVIINGVLNCDRFNFIVDRVNSDFDLTIGGSAELNAVGDASSIWRYDRSVPLSSFTNNGSIDGGRFLRFEARNGNTMVARNNGLITTVRHLYIRPVGAGSRVVLENNGSIDLERDLRLNARSGANQEDAVLDMRFTGATLNIRYDLQFDNAGGSILNDASNVTTTTMDRNGSQFITGDPLVSFHHLVFTGTGVKNLNSGDIPEGNLHGNFTLGGNCTLNMNSNSINCDGNVVLNGDVNADGNWTSDGDFTVGGDFSSNGSNIEVGGNWTRNGTYNFFQGDNITMNGTSPQFIINTTQFYELTIDNASGVTCVNDVSIKGILDIDNGNFNTGGNVITLISDASETAQMDDIGTGSYTGDLRVQRRIENTVQGWRELSCPVGGNTISTWQSNGLITSGFTGASSPTFPFLSIYTYEEANANGNKDDGWLGITNATQGLGHEIAHRVYMDASTITLDQNGVPNTGDITTDLSNDNEGSVDQYGWNLIGNPYAASIDWNLIDAGNRNGVDDAYWVYATEGMVTPQYGVFEGGDAVGTNGADGEIAHHQGFWVHCDGAFTGSNPSITFQESDKNVNSDNFVNKSSNPDGMNYLSISLKTPAGLTYDEAVIKTVQGASEGYILGEDYGKLYNSLGFWPYTINLAFTDTVEMADLSISAIGYDESDIVLKTMIGEYIHGSSVIMKFENMENYASNRCMILEDLHTGLSQDIVANPIYNFTADTTAGDIRFIIHASGVIEEQIANETCFEEFDGLYEVTGLPTSSVLYIYDVDNNLILTSGPDEEHSIDVLSAGTYIMNIVGTGCGNDSLVSVVEINGPVEIVADFEMDTNVINIGNSEQVVLTNLTTGAISYDWEMGDGFTYFDEVTPEHEYTEAGTYEITLQADNANYGECTQYITKSITVVEQYASVEDWDAQFKVYSRDGDFVVENGEMTIALGEYTVSVVNGLGQQVYNAQYTQNHEQILINTNQFTSGIYFVNIATELNNYSFKIKK